MNKFEKVIFNAIKKHAGLSDFDDEAVVEEVKSIMKALRKEKLVK